MFSVVRDKKDKIAKPASSMMQKVASALDPVGGATGPDGLDQRASGWGAAMQRMGQVQATNPLTAFAQAAGMGLAGYGQTKATQTKEAGTAAYKKRLADALAGTPDSAALMQLYNDPYADSSSQQLAMRMWERQNPTQDELQQRQMRELQMQQAQQGMTAQQQQMELQRQQAEQQAQAYQQQQAEYQRQQAIRGGKMDAVEGFMGQQEAGGGDLFSPEMQQALRAQGIQGVDPNDTRRYDAMQPYAQAGDYENAFQQMSAQPAAAEGYTLGEGQVRFGADNRPVAAGPAKRGSEGGAPRVEKITIADPQTGKPMDVTVQWSEAAQDWVELGRVPHDSANPTGGVKNPFDISKELSGDPTWRSAKVIQSTLNSMYNSLSDPSSISDLDFVNGVAKILDPNSVVREAEGRMVIESQSIPSQILGNLNKLANGESALDPQTRIAMYRLAERRGSETVAQAQQMREFSSGIATANGYDPSVYVPQLPPGPRGTVMDAPQNYPQTPEGWRPGAAPLPAPDAEGWITMPDGTRIRQKGN
ncbi:MAG TPA: hypothetical protein VK195_02875 [Burkholderiaceae bacterium]|nr:hypothetical protein [Burkholderiaceae bacterium]